MHTILIENHIAVCFALPTGTLACTYRNRYADAVVCDTVHSLFHYQRNHEHDNNYIVMLANLDVIFIDEISQISTEIFHHIIANLDKLMQRPVLMLSGDFALKQPIGTVDGIT